MRIFSAKPRRIVRAETAREFDRIRRELRGEWAENRRICERRAIDMSEEGDSSDTMREIRDLVDRIPDTLNEKNLLFANDVVFRVDDDLFPENRRTIPDSGHPEPKRSLHIERPFAGFEQTDDVNIFRGLDFHSRKNDERRSTRRADDGRTIVRRVVIRDRDHIEPLFERPRDDVRRPHLEFPAGRQNRMNMKIGPERTDHVSVHASPRTPNA